MPKRHDLPGFRFVSDTPPPSYQEYMGTAADQQNLTLTCDEILAKQLVMNRETSDRLSPAVFDDYCSGDEDIPDSYRLRDVSTGSDDSVAEKRRSPLLRQPAYSYETRRPSEVRRCMFLFQMLSKDFSDDDIEVDGEVVGDGVDCADGLDAVDGCADESCSNLTAFIRKYPENLRSMVASYLSTGRITDIVLCSESYHLCLHVAIALNLRQLKEHCIRHYFESDEADKITITGDCTCAFALEFESQKGYQRSESVISESDDNSPPEYYVAFSKAQKAPEKVRVIVLNMSDKLKVLQRVIEKPFGSGFACCSMELKESPFILVSGGENKSLNQVWKYDVIEGRWGKQAKLVHGRSSHIMTTCDDSLFVIGGKEVPCIEEYDAKGKKWMERASLLTPVYSAVSAVHDRKIYVFGGTTPAGPVATVQCYDTVSHKVTRLQDLPCQISNGQATVLNDNIYIASGQGHMIVFETRCGISNLCSEQPIRRENFGMFVKNDRIYLVGGELNEGDEVDGRPQYRYNPEKDCWVEKEKLNLNLPVYASCIIRYPKKCPVIPFDYSSLRPKQQRSQTMKYNRHNKAAFGKVVALLCRASIRNVYYCLPARWDWKYFNGLNGRISST